MYELLDDSLYCMFHFGNQNELMFKTHIRVCTISISNPGTPNIGEDGKMKTHPKAKSYLPVWIDNQKYSLQQSLGYRHKFLASSITEGTS